MRIFVQSFRYALDSPYLNQMIELTTDICQTGNSLLQGVYWTIMSIFFHIRKICQHWHHSRIYSAYPKSYTKMRQWQLEKCRCWRNLKHIILFLWNNFIWFQYILLQENSSTRIEHAPINKAASITILHLPTRCDIKGETLVLIR